MCGSRKGIYVRIVDAFCKCKICGTEDASNRALQRKDSQWYISTHTTQVHLKKKMPQPHSDQQSEKVILINKLD